MNIRTVRDERERQIDGEAERLVATVLSFGLLLLVLVRSLRGEAAWDLLALVVAGGLVGFAYRVHRRVVDRRLASAALVAMVLAAAVGVAIVAFVTR